MRWFTGRVRISSAQVRLCFSVEGSDLVRLIKGTRMGCGDMTSSPMRGGDMTSSPMGGGDMTSSPMGGGDMTSSSFHKWHCMLKFVFLGSRT